MLQHSGTLVIWYNASRLNAMRYDINFDSNNVDDNNNDNDHDENDNDNEDNDYDNKW